MYSIYGCVAEGCSRRDGDVSLPLGGTRQGLQRQPRKWGLAIGVLLLYNSIESGLMDHI